MVNGMSHFIFMSGDDALGSKSFYQVIHAVRPAIYQQGIGARYFLMDVDQPIHVFLIILVARLNDGFLVFCSYHINIVHHVALMARKNLDLKFFAIVQRNLLFDNFIRAKMLNILIVWPNVGRSNDWFPCFDKQVGYKAIGMVAMVVGNEKNIAMFNNLLDEFFVYNLFSLNDSTYDIECNGGRFGVGNETIIVHLEYFQAFLYGLVQFGQ